MTSQASAFSPADKFSVAPMIDVTDSLFRQLARFMTSRAMLYTEMIAAKALVHGKEYLIEYDKRELPCVLQLGGSDPKELAAAAKIGEKFGYSAINLNCGCPSDKVQSGSFGAVLMKTPDLITSCVQAMSDAVSIPVTVKTRIGVDDNDDLAYSSKIVGAVYKSGCRHIVLHARKAWLNGLSPKENRTVPPLDYERVFALKALYPDLFVTINGGITTLEQSKALLEKVDGVMLGRAVIDNPYLLASVDAVIFGDSVPIKSREDIFFKICDFAEDFVAKGNKLHHLGNHVLNFFCGCSGARRYRNYLSVHMHEKTCGAEVLHKAYLAMRSGS